jgi:Lon protease-like protein
MAARSFALRYEDLPAALPVFPLTGVLLLPEGRLPLNIFEPRYLAMVEDALAAKRLIGMIQPSAPVEAGTSPPPGTGPEGKEPALYETGCAGRIVSFSETGDGRFLITLTGLCRFRVAREVEGARGYRRVLPDWKPFRADIEPPANAGELEIDRPKLLAALRDYLALNEMEVDWSAIEGTPDAALAIVLPMSCPFEPREKQALLECATPAERAHMLVALMEMAVAEGRGGTPHVRQ